MAAAKPNYWHQEGASMAKDPTNPVTRKVLFTEIRHGVLAEIEIDSPLHRRSAEGRSEDEAAHNLRKQLGGNILTSPATAIG